MSYYLILLCNFKKLPWKDSVVVVVHGEVGAGKAEGLDGIGRVLEHLGHFRHFLGWEFAEHIVYLATSREAVAHAEAQTGVGLRAELGGDVLEAVVAGVRPLFADTYRAERKGKVVDHHKQLVEGQFLFVHPIAHGHAAEVHECGGLEQQQLAVLHLNHRHVAIPLRFKGDTGGIGYRVGDHEPGVVTGVDVFGTHIAQTGYQVTFHIGIGGGVLFPAAPENFLEYVHLQLLRLTEQPHKEKNTSCPAMGHDVKIVCSRSGSGVFVCLCHGATGGTGELYGTNHSVLGVHQLEALEVEIAHCHALAELQMVNVDHKTLGNLAAESFHFQLAHGKSELTTGLDTLGVTFDLHGHLHNDGFVGINLKEIDVENGVLNGLELQLLHHGLHGSAGEVDVNLEDVGGVDELANILRVDGDVSGDDATFVVDLNEFLTRCELTVEGKLNNLATVDNCGDLALFAQSLYSFLAELRTGLGCQFECLHFFKLVLLKISYAPCRQRGERAHHIGMPTNFPSHILLKHRKVTKNFLTGKILFHTFQQVVGGKHT